MSRLSFEIIKDVEKGIAAIIDPEVGRALGPIGFGEDAAKLLETFAGAHGVDPTKLPTPLLESRWEKFVTDLADVQDAIERKPGDEGTGTPPTADGSASTHAEPSTAASETGTDTAEAGKAGPTPVESPGADVAAPSQESSDDVVNGPVTTPKPGNIVCPTCDGWRTIAQAEAEVKCPTCKGEGEVLGEQPEPADDTGAVS